MLGEQLVSEVFLLYTCYHSARKWLMSGHPALCNHCLLIL